MELCPKCKMALKIAKSHVRVSGDNAPDTPTRVYTVLDQICTTPGCENYSTPAEPKIVDSIEVLQYETPMA